MPNILTRFVQDEHTKQAVYNYVIAYLSQLAITRVFKQEPTVGLADAKTVLDEAFLQMEREFSPPKDPSNINEAR